MWQLFKKKVTGSKFEHLSPCLEFSGCVIKTDLTLCTSDIWSAVSISRSQFDDHYIQTIKNIAVYLQNPVQFSHILRSARDGVMATQIVKLPLNRQREESAKFEQLWKYVMFCCYMLRGASENPVQHYNAAGRRVICPVLDGSGYFLLQGENTTRFVVQNITNLLPLVSQEWILRDRERGFIEISNAANGDQCFIDKTANVEAVRKPRIPEPPEKPLLDPDVSIDEDGVDLTQVLVEECKVSTAVNNDHTIVAPVIPKKPKKTSKRAGDDIVVVEQQSAGDIESPAIQAGVLPVSHNGSTDAPPARKFRLWLKHQRLPIDEKSGLTYIVVPDQLKEFLLYKKSKVSLSSYENKLIELGYEVIKKEVDRTEVSVMLIPENT